jgi:hypothetical protein
VKFFSSHTAVKYPVHIYTALSIEPSVRQGNGLLLPEFKFSILLDRAETKSSYCPVTEFNAPATLTQTATSLPNKI